MNVVFCVAIYPPECEPAAVMAKEIAIYLKQVGHNVTVVCPFPNRPKGKVFDGYQRTFRQIADEEGIRVIRVGTWLVGAERKLFNRVMEGCSFGVASAIALLRERSCDVLLLETWPIFGQLPAVLAAKTLKIPVVNYIQDIFPDAAVAAGILSKKSTTTRILKQIDSFICNASTQNIVVSEGMRDVFTKERGLQEHGFTICWNWLNLSTIKPSKGNSWRQEVGLTPDDFVCMYAGTFGLASGVEILLDVAESVKERHRIRIVCIGDGVRRKELLAEKERRSLTNFLVLPFQPRERLSEVQSSADVMILTSSPDMGLSSIPSKFITYLAVGKPVICSIDAASDIGKTVTEQNLGRVVAPGNAKTLADAIVDLEQMEARLLVEMGERARQVALSRYSADSALKKIVGILSQAAQKQ